MSTRRKWHADMANFCNDFFDSGKSLWQWSFVIQCLYNTEALQRLIYYRRGKRRTSAGRIGSVANQYKMRRMGNQTVTFGLLSIPRELNISTVMSVTAVAATVGAVTPACLGVVLLPWSQSVIVVSIINDYKSTRIHRIFFSPKWHVMCPCSEPLNHTHSFADLYDGCLHTVTGK